jgi:hypothetical protein
MTEQRPHMTLGDQELTVEKYAVTIPVSCCLAGTCRSGDHPAPPRAPWWRRARWRVARVWGRRPRMHLGPCRTEEEDW